MQGPSFKKLEKTTIKSIKRHSFFPFSEACLDLSFVYFHMCSLGHGDTGGANADSHRHPWTPPCNSIVFKHTHAQPFLSATRLKHFATAGGREVRPGTSPSQGFPIPTADRQSSTVQQSLSQDILGARMVRGSPSSVTC